MSDWTKPREVTDVEVAFGANALDYMPPREECEAALKALPNRGREWREFQSRWFFEGLPTDTKFKPKDGIDQAAALRHLSLIQGSYAPKHEHKEAAVAYLASLWFKDVKMPKRDKAAA